MNVEFLVPMTIAGTNYARKQVASINDELAADLIIRGQALEFGSGTFKLSKLYTDLTQTAAGINPAGAADAPSVDQTLTGFPGTLLFAGNLENVIVGQWQIVHEWQEGTALYPHIHWALTEDSANDPDWRFYYRYAGIGSRASDWVGPVSASHDVSSGTANVHRLSTFGSIPLLGETVSCFVFWRLHRLGATDTNADAARLFGIDAHYRKNRDWLGQEPLR